MGWNDYIYMIIFGAIFIVGTIAVVYQIYHMTVIDAKARGLKRPKLWGIFSLSGSGSSGLVIYLLGRKKYPIINISDEDKKEIDTRKKIVGVGLIFLAIGAIGLVISITLMQ